MSPALLFSCLLLSCPCLLFTCLPRGAHALEEFAQPSYLLAVFGPVAGPLRLERSLIGLAGFGGQTLP